MSSGSNMNIPKVPDELVLTVEITRIAATFPLALQESGRKMTVKSLVSRYGCMMYMRIGGQVHTLRFVWCFSCFEAETFVPGGRCLAPEADGSWGSGR